MERRGVSTQFTLGARGQGRTGALEGSLGLVTDTPQGKSRPGRSWDKSHTLAHAGPWSTRPGPGAAEQQGSS